MRIKILGKYWKIKFVTYLGGSQDLITLGTCENPKHEKIIKFKKGETGKEEFRVYNHEFIHAVDYEKSEEYVDELSRDLTNFLWRLGYRKLTKEQIKKYEKEQY